MLFSVRRCDYLTLAILDSSVTKLIPLRHKIGRQKKLGGTSDLPWMFYCCLITKLLECLPALIARK